MVQKVISAYTVFSLLFIAVPAFAVPNQTAMELTTPAFEGKDLLLPDAADNAPVIVPLGTAVDPATGKTVEGIKFIHYKKGFDHKSNHVKGGGGNTTSVCYAFLGNGAKWKTAEDYIVDGTNNQGIATATIESLIDTAIETWDSEVLADVFGVRVAGTVDGIDQSSPDTKNEVLFGSIDSPGAIAITIVWGIFRGPPSGRELIEWDQMYDEVDFDWTADGTFSDTDGDGQVDQMDFLNIAVHEVGHAAGMGHPSDSCVDESMYRFAGSGETKKRDLNTGDIAGIKALYP